MRKRKGGIEVSDRTPYEWTPDYILEHTIPQTDEERIAIKEYFRIKELGVTLQMMRQNLCEKKEYEKLDEIDDKVTECCRRMSALEDSNPIKTILDNEYNRRTEETRRQYQEEETAKIERWKAEYHEKRQQAIAAREQRILNEQMADNNQKQYIYCVYCGSKMDAGDRFCVNCGKPVYGGEDSASKGNYWSTITVTLVILAIIAWVIVSNLSIIMDLGDGSFGKGIIIFPLSIVGGLLIFKAFGNLLQDADKLWKGIAIFLVMVLCLVGFIEIMKGL